MTTGDTQQPWPQMEADVHPKDLSWIAQLYSAGGPEGVVIVGIVLLVLLVVGGVIAIRKIQAQKEPPAALPAPAPIESAQISSVVAEFTRRLQEVAGECGQLKATVHEYRSGMREQCDRCDLHRGRYDAELKRIAGDVGALGRKVDDLRGYIEDRVGKLGDQIFQIASRPNSR